MKLLGRTWNIGCGLVRHYPCGGTKENRENLICISQWPGQLYKLVTEYSSVALTARQSPLYTRFSVFV
jgi:hypothetical protein